MRIRTVHKTETLMAKTWKGVQLIIGKMWQREMPW